MRQVVLENVLRWNRKQLHKALQEKREQDAARFTHNCQQLEDQLQAIQ